MKYFVALIFVLANYACRAQNITPNPHNEGSPPVFFLDSVKISFNDNRFRYIMGEEFKTMNIEKKDNKYPGGSIYITLKDHNRLAELMNDKLLSLKQIAYTHVDIAERDKKILYLINDVLLTDTTNVSIPSKYIKKVDVVPAGNMPYFKTAMPNVLLLKISTKDPVMHIRGNNFNEYPIPALSN